jgi:hypothetical protein
MTLFALMFWTILLWAVLQLVPEIKNPKWQRVVRLALLIVFILWIAYGFHLAPGTVTTKG